MSTGVDHVQGQGLVDVSEAHGRCAPIAAAVVVSIGYVLTGHAASRDGIAMQLPSTFGVRGACFPS